MDILVNCFAKDCKWIRKDELVCDMGEITINENGECEDYEEVDKG